MGCAFIATILDHSLHAAQVEFFWLGFCFIEVFARWDPIPQSAVLLSVDSLASDFPGSHGPRLDFPCRCKLC